MSLRVSQVRTQTHQAPGIQQHLPCFFSLNTHQTRNIVDIWKIRWQITSGNCWPNQICTERDLGWSLWPRNLLISNPSSKGEKEKTKDTVKQGVLLSPEKSIGDSGQQTLTGDNSHLVLCISGSQNNYSAGGLVSTTLKHQGFGWILNSSNIEHFWKLSSSNIIKLSEILKFAFRSAKYLHQNCLKTSAFLYCKYARLDEDLSIFLIQ